MLPTRAPLVLLITTLPHAVALAARRVVVFAAEASVTEVLGRGNLEFEVPPSAVGNNAPERRRNLLIKALSENISPSPSVKVLSDATAVHTAGYTHFLGTAFSRWETELNSDRPQVKQISILTNLNSNRPQPKQNHLQLFKCVPVAVMQRYNRS